MISEFTRKTRSSMKRSSDSVWDDSVTERPRGRRVSFSRIISVKNNENSEEQFPLSLTSEDPVDVIKSGPDGPWIQNAIPIENMSDMSVCSNSPVPCSLNSHPITSNDPTNDIQSEPDMPYAQSVEEDVSEMSLCTNEKDPRFSDSVTSPGLCTPHMPSYGDMSVDQRSAFVSQWATSFNSPIVEPVESANNTLTENLSVVKTPVISTDTDMNSDRGCDPPPYLSNRPIAASLPPLRDHPNMPIPLFSALSCSRSSHTNSNNTSRFGQPTASHLLSLRSDSKLLSQSLAATPLRQVTSKRWTGSFPWHNGKPIHPNPEVLIPSVNRLQKHALRLSFFSVCEILKEDLLSTPEALQQFLQLHSATSLESDEPVFPMFADLDQLQDLFPHLYSELIHQRQRVHRLMETRLIKCVQESETRCSDILLSQSNSLPVVQQLRKMGSTQVAEFLTQAHERLRQCELDAKQSYSELLAQQVEEFNAEQALECERIMDTQSFLDKELLSLTRQLEQLTTKLKSQNQLESYLKETLKYLNILNEERCEIHDRFVTTEAENSRLIQLLNEKMTAGNFVNFTNDLLPVCVGASPLLPPVTSSEKLVSQTIVPEEDEVALMLTPSILNRVSSENHTYSLRTLFGLLSFTFECDLLPSTTSGKQVLDVPIKNLLVSSVSCCLPPNSQSVLDCPAVESFADYIIHFFNSREGRSQLSARLVGATLDKAVEHAEYILCPYLLLAADLRAISLADHDVEFDMVYPTDFSLLASTYKSYLSSTPSRSVLHDRNPTQSRLPWDHYLNNRILPNSPINIIVTVYNHQVRAIVSLHFSFATIDNDQSATSAWASTIFGRIRRDPVQQLLDSCKISPGSIHRVVSMVNEHLSSLKD